MLINVTQGNIDNGKSGNCSSCPVALAFNDAGFPDAFVNGVRVYPKYGINGKKLPIEAQSFIARFDCGYAVKPFSFEVDLPENEQLF